MNKFCLLIMSLLLLLSSCTDTIYDNTITVAYLTGNINTSVPYEFACLKQSQMNIKADTIIIDSADFKSIYRFLSKSHYTELKNKNCDARIYVSCKNKEVCLGLIDCMVDRRNKVFEQDLKSAYLIKWKSGYFNYYQKEDLEFDATIRLYGIPSDYAEVEEEIGEPPQYMVKKILKVRYVKR